jgi:hypothetical protein
MILLELIISRANTGIQEDCQSKWQIIKTKKKETIQNQGSDITSDRTPKTRLSDAIKLSQRYCNGNVQIPTGDYNESGKNNYAKGKKYVRYCLFL